MRKIDSLVAQFIMGWEHEENRSGAGWKNAQGIYSHRVNCWNPTTRLEQAWEVVEKLSSYERKQLTWHEDRKQWCFTFGRGTLVNWSAFADTPSLAICLSALHTANVGYFT